MRLIKSDERTDKQLIQDNIESLHMGIEYLTEEFTKDKAWMILQKLKQLIEFPIKAKKWQEALNNIPEMKNWIGEIGAGEPHLRTGFLEDMERSLKFIMRLEYMIENPTEARYEDELY